jgi:hypothetical protein
VAVSYAEPIVVEPELTAVDDSFFLVNGLANDEKPVAPVEESAPPSLAELELDPRGNDDAARVRPYAFTGGRTRSTVHLELETLVSVNDNTFTDQATMSLEHREIGDLCRSPLSVAEVAATMGLPLGVARVLLADMSELGLITVHRTWADDDMAAHLVLMERVLSGLRRL